MADQTTILDVIPSGVAQPEVPANALFDAASPGALYGRHSTATTALTWGYYGGTLITSSGSRVGIANGTVALSASATNYVEADPADGTVSKNTAAFTAGRIPLYVITTGTDSVANYTDERALAYGVQVPSSTQPYIAGGAWNNKPAVSEVILRHIFTDAVTFPSGLTNSQGKAETAATAQTDFDIQKNGSSVGTMRFAAAGTTASFIMASQQSFAAGDVLKVIAPASQDTTLANLTFSLRGTR